MANKNTMRRKKLERDELMKSKDFRKRGKKK